MAAGFLSRLVERDATAAALAEAERIAGFAPLPLLPARRRCSVPCAPAALPPMPICLPAATVRPISPKGWPPFWPSGRRAGVGNDTAAAGCALAPCAAAHRGGGGGADPVAYSAIGARRRAGKTTGRYALLPRQRGARRTPRCGRPMPPSLPSGGFSRCCATRGCIGNTSAAWGASQMWRCRCGFPNACCGASCSIAIRCSSPSATSWHASWHASAGSPNATPLCPFRACCGRATGRRTSRPTSSALAWPSRPPTVRAATC